MELYIGAFALILFLLLILSWIWPPDSPWAPWWRTDHRLAHAACRLAKITEKDTVYELGSGDAGMLITAAKECGAHGVGIEVDPSRHYVAIVHTWMNGVSQKIKLIKDNFFNVKFGPATVVFVYLVPNALKRLEKKMKKELKPGTRVVSLRYEI